jgi:hypothetical protein
MARQFAINALTTTQQYPTNGKGAVSATAALGGARGRVIVHGVYLTIGSATATNIELTKKDGTSYSPTVNFGTPASTTALAQYPNLDIELDEGLGFKNSNAATAWIIVYSSIGGG